MIIPLPNTSTREISATLLDAHDNYSLATGRVLTLIVVAAASDDVDSILVSVRDATQEHPARVLVMLLGDPAAPTTLDAECILTADAGASEMVVMHLGGELTANLDAVVTPLILPDTPIAAWWPTTAPACPAQAPLGNIAQRRITNARRNVSGNALLRLSNGYTPGDSDMMWSRITPWRGIVASASDRHQGEDITAVTISGPVDNPSVDIAAGWLASSLGVDVTRCPAPPTSEIIENVPITELRLCYERGDIVVSVIDEHTVRVSVPGSPDSYVAMTARTDAECLAEELRHLDPDTAYSRALQGLSHVKES
ncbi:glucose-6-phosphate dehydrogenase assembly protein OpcA [Corynebacterium liangguodongii]|uniref:Oxppcycle protein OpcA n=1 Tax=Corynebacterium liangguodongii TaxID=2079535 RepID=A0A2S0WEG4_9CORY|nr:glucose-6-phosphate dehydrogenase assembly protein OpcA [Corynebacterium liangguodongii]AWB84052.1 oxppcycle protein OpcA [Corynebacterium liangguodongii]PWC00063.1 oxppcycle protein OpcA [Corynebacterium liangguodongii]